METWSITAVHVTTILLVSLALLSALYREDELRLYRTPLDLPAVLFLTVAVISACTSVYPHASRILLYRIINCLALFSFIVHTHRETRKLLLLCRVIVLSGGVQAVTGLILTNGSLFGFEVQSHGHYGISLFFANHSHFAGYLELTIWLAVGLATVTRGAERLVLLTLALLMMAAAVFSLSRGGIIGLTAGLCFYLAVFVGMKEYMSGSLRFLIIFVLLAAALLVWLGFGPVMDRMKTLHDPLTAGRARIALWQATMKMITDCPLFGWGPGTYSSAFPAYQPELLAGRFVNHAHNDYLELASETGLAGLAAALLAVLAFFISCLRRLSRAELRYFQPIGIGALAGCCAFLVHAATDFNFYIPSNAILCAVTAAIAVLAADRASGEENTFGCIVIRSKKIGKKWIFAAGCSAAFLSCAGVLSPYLGERYAQLSWTAQEKKDYEQAKTALHTALLLDPGNAELMKRTGDLLFTQSVTSLEQEKNLQQVLAWYEKAIHTCPVQGGYFSHKAYVLQRLGQMEQAEQAYQQALQLYPVHAFASYRLADLYLSQKRYDEALRYFRRFLVLGKQRYLSMVLNRLSGVGMDFDTLKKAVPETAPFRRAFAAYLFAQGKNQPALHELEFAFTLEPTPHNALAHVRGLFRSKDFTAALEQNTTYLERFPTSLGLREQKARILERLGRRQEAVFIYRNLQQAVYAGEL
ncbi:MAG: hypothetical protein D3921_15190, partial [Candidatus Electrothrix sp. AW1]|nr:hypothetical protein [Candidatus Electrothrix gigas]